MLPAFTGIGTGSFNVGLLHANVGGNTDHESYAPCTLSDLQRTAIDYWALGHVHTKQVLLDRNPTVVYPGNPQGRHPNETGARGVYLVEVSDSGDVRLDFRAVDLVRWARLEVDVGPFESEQSLIDAIQHEPARCQKEADGRSVIYRLALTGRGQLHTWLNRKGVADDLLEMVNEMRDSGTPFLWCERIQLLTAPAIDLEQQRQRTDFVGDLIRLCDDALADTQILNGLRVKLQDLYEARNPGRHLREHLPSGDELLELVASAQNICIEELLGEDAI